MLLLRRSEVFGEGLEAKLQQALDAPQDWITSNGFQCQ